MKRVAVSIHAIDRFDPDIIENLDGLDYIHVDFMDGKFVESKNLNTNVLKQIKAKYDLPIIAHLMVDEPIKFVNRIIDDVDFFVFHFESKGNKEELIKKVKYHKRQVGIAINPETPLTKIMPFLNDLDLVLIMSVNPGWSGQDFIWESIDKVDLLIAYRAYMKMGFLIDIDGGINLKNAGFINADIVSSSSTILKAENPNKVIQKLKEIEYHD
ncbi:MAG: ribulose-phosphate 3-epimerase [Promethearchaeota archaeon]